MWDVLMKSILVNVCKYVTVDIADVDGSNMRNVKYFYQGQSPTDYNPEFGESHVSAEEISRESHNPDRKPAMCSSEINFCEPDIHTHCTNELNSNVEGSPVLDINMYFRDLPTKYPRNLILAHINVNSIRYKFYEISNIFTGNCIEIFGIYKTKIDAVFLQAHNSVYRILKCTDRIEIQKAMAVGWLYISKTRYLIVNWTSTLE